MDGKRWVILLFPLLVLSLFAACNDKPTPIATSSNNLSTSTATIEVPKPTNTPAPPTVTATDVPPTPTVTPTPQIFPIAGKWIGRGDRNLLIHFSVVTDNKSFIVIRDFSIPRTTTLCAGWYLELKPLPDMYVRDDEFGYSWFPSKITAQNKIEGDLYPGFCAIKNLKWQAVPETSN